MNRFHATALSRDGRTLVGYGNLQVAGSLDPVHALAWSVANGTRDFGRTPARAVSASADGSRVLVLRQLDAQDETWLWTSESSTRVRLPRTGTARDVSADGAVIVGDLAQLDSAVRHAFRWTEGDGVLDLGEIDRFDCARVGCQHGSQANAVSDDGRVVVGATNGAAYRWTESGGMVELPVPAGLPLYVTTRSDATFEAVDTSADGAVTVGNVRASDEVFPVRWTDAGGETFGALSQPGRELGLVRAVSGDGSVCVGASERLRQAWIWTTTSGMRSLADVLEGAGVDTEGWEFHSATGISGDGKVVAGDGAYQHRPLALIVRLP